MSKLATKLLLILIRIYQKVISPFLPARCRYYPTCSEYGKLALLWHGPWRGLALTTNRILRCHPFGGQGVDFVPLPLYQDTFVAITSTSGASSLCFFDDSLTYDHSLPLLDNLLIKQQTSVCSQSMTRKTYLWIPEHGVFMDGSSYNSRLNHRLKHSSHKLGSEADCLT